MKQTEFNFTDKRHRKESRKEREERIQHEYNELRFLGALKKMSHVFNKEGESQQDVEE